MKYTPDLLTINVDPHIQLSQSVDRAESFAHRYSLPLTRTADFSSIQSSYVLNFSSKGTEIVPIGKGAPGPVSASFVGGKAEHRRKFGGGKGQLIAKAVGLKPGIYPHVLDATAGLGRDAFVLATLGCKVSMVERSPIVAELLQSALEEGRGGDISDICRNMSLIAENASEWLALQAEAIADVIYLDPMYPHRDKSSLVKKEMRVFHDLVGQDQDTAELLNSALEKARYRVVVKRPRKGDLIDGPKPSLQLMGKSTRYDIYTFKAMDGLKA